MVGLFAKRASVFRCSVLVHFSNCVILQMVQGIGEQMIMVVVIVIGSSVISVGGFSLLSA